MMGDDEKDKLVDIMVAAWLFVGAYFEGEKTDGNLQLTHN